MEKKKKIFFATTTNTAGETIIRGTQYNAVDDQEFGQMDVVINVRTLTGTSITFSIQELIDGTTYMETGKSSAITATGVYVLNFTQVPSSNLTNTMGPFPVMGRGFQKRVVTTASSLSGLAADIYFIFSK